MIQKLFKKYIVRRDNGQCQILIPLVELDTFCEQIETYIKTEQLPKRKPPQGKFNARGRK